MMTIGSSLMAIAMIVPAMALTPPRSPDQMAEDAKSMRRAAALIEAQVARCLVRPEKSAGAKATLRFYLQIDGTLRAPPQLLEQPATPAQLALADAASRAIEQCAPFDVPEEFRGSPYLWTTQTIAFE
jgi:hypothetical protein